MIKPSLQTPGGNIGLGQKLLDLGGQLRGTRGGEGGLVEVIGKTVEVVDQIGGTAAVVEVDLARGGRLPVGGEDDHGGGLDARDDFVADGLQDGVDGVGGVILDVGLRGGVSGGFLVWDEMRLGSGKLTPP